MAVEPAATQAWARENRAAWEVAPLVEMHKGQRLQVGFELDLYARIPAPASQSEGDPAVAETLWDRLREIAESLLPLAGEGARIELEPFDAAGRLRAETQFAPEVLLQARLFHSSDYFAPVGEGDRERMRPIELQLGALGLRQRCW